MRVYHLCRPHWPLLCMCASVWAKQAGLVHVHIYLWANMADLVQFVSRARSHGRLFQMFWDSEDLMVQHPPTPMPRHHPIHRSLVGGPGRKPDMLCVQLHHRCKHVCSRSLLDGRLECGDCGERWIPGQPARSPPLLISITFPWGVRCGMSDISCGVPSPMRGSMREP